MAQQQRSFGPPHRALAHGPFGLFRPVDGPSGEPSVLDRVGLGEAAKVYELCWEARRMLPDQVDRHELWQLANLLGIKAGGMPQPGRPGHGLSGRALLKARIEAQRRGEEPPRL